MAPCIRGTSALRCGLAYRLYLVPQRSINDRLMDALDEFLAGANHAGIDRIGQDPVKRAAGDRFAAAAISAGFGGEPLGASEVDHFAHAAEVAISDEQSPDRRRFRFIDHQRFVDIIIAQGRIAACPQAFAF